jgi:hypothetical protein
MLNIEKDSRKLYKSQQHLGILNNIEIYLVLLFLLIILICCFIRLYNIYYGIIVYIGSHCYLSKLPEY